MSAALQCPRCTRPLHVAERHELTIAPCFECGGLWLSSAASMTVKAAMDAQASHAASAAERDARAPQPENTTGGALLRCPVCADTLQRWSVGDVEVDHCPTHGTWYDRGELQEVQRHLIRAQAPIGAPPNYSVEDSGLELAHAPTRGRARAAVVSRGQLKSGSDRHVVQGMIAAEMAYRRDYEQRHPGEGSFSALTTFGEDDGGWFF